MKRLGVYGAPVSAVSLTSPDHCLFGQGSFLNQQPVLPGNIHGIRCADPVSIVFGGRYVAFLKNSSLKVLSIQRDDVSVDYLTLSDWIWDCACDTQSPNTTTVMIALAHGAVQLWSLQFVSDTKVQLQRTRVVVLCQQTPSLVQTLCISNRQVAMAQDGAIHVWSIDKPSSLSTIRIPIAGTMHSLRFRGNRLASVSNDRSVRLWELGSQQWQERWTAWGHTARVWDVAFVREDFVVSTGGDNTIRLWDWETGRAMNVWNTQRCMRSLDTYDSYIAAGGNDGTVVIYNVDGFCKPICGSLVEVKDASRTNICRFSVPDDRPSTHSTQTSDDNSSESQTKEMNESTTSESVQEVKRQKKTKKKVTKQVLVGAEVCTFQSRLSMAVATRLGSFLLLDLSIGYWLRLADWEEVPNAKNGCCMKIHPEFPVAAIGSTNGYITIVRFDGFVGTLATKTTLNASTYRSVQTMEWIDSMTLVTYHIHTVIIWTFSSSIQLNSADISHESYQMRVLEAQTKGMVICGAFNEEQTLFAAGDTRGNLLLFDLQITTEATLQPVSSLPYCHRKEHINALVWVSKNKILSVGNDGCIAETWVTADYKLEALLSVLSGQLTGITHIFKHSKNKKKDSCHDQPLETLHFDDISIAGYMGNRFSLLDATSGYEFANVDTSGRHRTLEIYTPKGFPQTSLMVVRESRVDGGTDLVVSTFGFGIDGTDDIVGERDEHVSAPISCSYGLPLHNDSIFGLCLFPLNLQQVAVVCASEDCFITISIFQDEKLVTVKRLPPMVSGVRVVCNSSSTLGRNLLAFGGGQLEIMFYIADSNQHGDDDFTPLLSFIGCGIPSEKQVVDQRINAMKAVFLNGTSDEPRHLVVTGDSEGSCCMYMVAESRSRRTLGYTFFRSDRPILSLDLCKDGDAIFVIAGTTNGFVYVFEASEKLLLDNELEKTQLFPIATYRGHSMGANAIAARLIVKPRDNNKILRIASVGDDQAIYGCDVRVKDSAGRVSILSQTVKPEASLSALKGVEWTSDNTFVTVGYDQRVVHWSILNEIAPLSVAPVSIGDVNCLGMCKGLRRPLIAVGGAGVELICIEDDYVQ